MQNIMENFEINLNNHEIIHKDIIMENVLWILTLYVKTSPSIPLSIGNFFFNEGGLYLDTAFKKEESPSPHRS